MFKFTLSNLICIFLIQCSFVSILNGKELSSRQEKRYIQQIKKAFTTKRFDQCASIIHQLIENEELKEKPSENYPFYLTAQTYFYYYSGKPEYAKENIYKLLQTDQNDEILYYNSSLLAEIYSSERNPEACYDILRSLENSIPELEWELHIQNLYKAVSRQLTDTYDYHYQQAQSAFEHQDYSVAKNHYDIIFNALIEKRYLNKTSITVKLHTLEETAYHLSVCYGYENQWKDVIRTLTELPTLLSEDPRQNSLVADALLLLSKAYRKNGLYEDSLTTLITLSSMDPTIQDENVYLLELALSYFYFGNNSKSMTYFERLASRSSNRSLLPLINYYIAHVHMDNGNFHKTHQIINKLELDRRAKSTAFASLLKAKSFYLQGQYKEAINPLEDLLSKPKQLTQDLIVDANLLASSIYLSTDYNLSIAHLKKALSISNRDDLYIQLLDQYFTSFTSINPFDTNSDAYAILQDFDPLSDEAKSTTTLYKSLLIEDPMEQLKGLYNLTLPPYENTAISYKAYWHAGNIFYLLAQNSKGKTHLERINSAIEALEIALYGFENNPILSFEATMDLAETLILMQNPESKKRACTRLQALNRNSIHQSIPKPLLQRYHLLFAKVILTMPFEINQPSFQHDLKDQLNAIEDSDNLAFRIQAYTELIPLAAQQKTLRSRCCKWLYNIALHDPLHEQLPKLTYYLEQTSNIPLTAVNICKSAHPQSLYTQLFHFKSLKKTRALPYSFTDYLNLLEDYPLSDAYAFINNHLFKQQCQKKFSKKTVNTLYQILLSYYTQPEDRDYSLLSTSDKNQIFRAEMKTLKSYLAYLQENSSKIRLTDLEHKLSIIYTKIDCKKQLLDLTDREELEWNTTKNLFHFFLN